MLKNELVSQVVVVSLSRRFDWSNSGDPVGAAAIAAQQTAYQIAILSHNGVYTRLYGLSLTTTAQYTLGHLLTSNIYGIHKPNKKLAALS